MKIYRWEENYGLYLSEDGLYYTRINTKEEMMEWYSSTMNEPIIEILQDNFFSTGKGENSEYFEMKLGTPKHLLSYYAFYKGQKMELVDIDNNGIKIYQQPVENGIRFDENKYIFI